MSATATVQAGTQARSLITLSNYPDKTLHKNLNI